MKINNGKSEFVAIKDHIEHAFKKKKGESWGVARIKCIRCNTIQTHIQN